MHKNKKSDAMRKRGTGIVLVLLLLVLIAGVVFLLRPELVDSIIGTESTTEQVKHDTVDESDPPIQIESVEEVLADLGNGLTITDIGSYAGMYMEDGSDEIVSGVLMIVVTNNGAVPLQYAEISLRAGEETANFALSTLPAGESVVVLEQNRMSYDSKMDYISAETQNVAWFTEALSLCDDKLQIQSLDGAMNITNISGEDITGEIIIYYKNSSADMLYGGITYRVRITDGLTAGEMKQIVSDHYTASGSTIMFVTCG